jgi:hypothetical protein
MSSFRGRVEHQVTREDGKPIFVKVAVSTSTYRKVWFDRRALVSRTYQEDNWSQSMDCNDVISIMELRERVRKIPEECRGRAECLTVLDALIREVPTVLYIHS